jgi:hypothetical protein
MTLQYANVVNFQKHTNSSQRQAPALLQRSNRAPCQLVNASIREAASAISN